MSDMQVYRMWIAADHTDDVVKAALAASGADVLDVEVVSEFREGELVPAVREAEFPGALRCREIRVSARGPGASRVAAVAADRGIPSWGTVTREFHAPPQPVVSQVRHYAALAAQDTRLYVEALGVDWMRGEALAKRRERLLLHTNYVLGRAVIRCGDAGTPFRGVVIDATDENEPWRPYRFRRPSERNITLDTRRDPRGIAHIIMDLVELSMRDIYTHEDRRNRIRKITSEAMFRTNVNAPLVYAWGCLIADEKHGGF